MTKQSDLPKARGFDVWLNVGRNNLRVHRALNLLLGRIDLSLAQHEIMVAIRQQSGLSQRELAERLLLVKSNATALLGKLESRGLVAREADKSDSRRKLLKLTVAGNKLVEQSFALQNKVVSAMASVMSDDELDQMQVVAKRVGKALDELIEDEKG